MTKDDDFRQLAIAHSQSPKVIWLTVGNCTPRLVVSLLRDNLELLEWFNEADDRSIITLDIA